MKKFCNYNDCQQDWNEQQPTCLCGEPDYKKCDNYIGDKEAVPTTGTEEKTVEDTNEVGWSSSAMGSIDLEFISAKHQPFIIGVIGQSKTGKTTFLATLYMLLRAGKSIGQYKLAGSYTLLGWEKIANFLTFNYQRKISFPPHTSANMSRVPGLLHLLLKNDNDCYKDLIFTDAPGEWFTEWAKSADSSSSVGAKWIDDAAAAFILIADCSAFKVNLGKERHSLMQIVERMKNTYQNRPTALAWTKSDEDFEPNLKEIILQKVQVQLPNVLSYDIAVINRKTEENLNDILKIVEILLQESQELRNVIAPVKVQNDDDFFFTIR